MKKVYLNREGAADAANQQDYGQSLCAAFDRR